MKRLHSHDNTLGTGIGLSTGQRILEIYGESIGATSKPGKGRTFYVVLPKKGLNPVI